MALASRSNSFGLVRTRINDYNSNALYTYLYAYCNRLHVSQMNFLNDIRDKCPPYSLTPPPRHNPIYRAGKIYAQNT